MDIFTLLFILLIAYMLIIREPTKTDKPTTKYRYGYTEEENQEHWLQS